MEPEKQSKKPPINHNEAFIEVVHTLSQGIGAADCTLAENAMATIDKFYVQTIKHALDMYGWQVWQKRFGTWESGREYVLHVVTLMAAKACGSTPHEISSKELADAIEAIIKEQGKGVFCEAYRKSKAE
jgi:hypothetical protein